MKTLTIYEIKELTKETSPYFFNHDTMRWFGQTLRMFKVKKQPDGKYLISCPSYMSGKKVGTTQRLFNPVTNELEFV